jgi:hypothetical protein
VLGSEHKPEQTSIMLRTASSLLLHAALNLILSHNEVYLIPVSDLIIHPSHRRLSATEASPFSISHLITRNRDDVGLSHRFKSAIFPACCYVVFTRSEQNYLIKTKLPEFQPTCFEIIHLLKTVSVF